MWSCNKCGFSTDKQKQFAGHIGGHKRLGKKKPIEELSESYKRKLTILERKLNGSFNGRIPKFIPFEKLKKDATRKKRLIEKRGHQCESCKLTEWLGKKIPVELDHIDGHPGHNLESNLRLLCPNCHAQTPFYRGANKGRHSKTQRQEKASKYPNYRKLKINNLIE